MEEKRLVIAKADNPSGFRVSDVRLVNDQLQERINKALAEAEELTLIQSEEDKQNFMTVQAHVLDALGDITEIHRMVKQPFLDACRKIDEAKRKAEAELVKVSGRLQEEFARIYGGKRREQQEERREIVAFAEKTWKQRQVETDPEKREELMETAMRAQFTAESVVTTVPGIKIRTGWEPHLENPLTVMQTNPGFLAIDIKRRVVQDAIKKEQEDGHEIKEDTFPGIKLVPKDSVTLRR